MAIDFTLSEMQKQLQSDARSFAQATLKRVTAITRSAETMGGSLQRFYAIRPFYEAMVCAGFLKGLLPAAIGGTGMSLLDLAIAAEELTAVDVNVPSALLATGLALQPLIRFGTADQCERFLKPFINSEAPLAAFAFTEVTGGANYDCPDPSAGVQTFAHLEGNEWIISGRKHYTTNGTGWDGQGPELMTVICRTDPSLTPRKSLAAILVPKGVPGLQVEGVLETMGHRATISPRVRFQNVRVPADNILGRPGDGIDIVETAFSWTAPLVAAASLGVMRAAFDTALNFSKTDRRSGTVPVIEHQSVGYMLADVKMKIEAARYLTWKACHQFDSTNGQSRELAIMAKVYCSELCVQAVYDAMRVVGINSYTDILPLASLMQDAICFPLYDGGNMGMRRRQLHAILRAPDYDSMAAAEGRHAGR